MVITVFILQIEKEPSPFFELKTQEKFVLFKLLKSHFLTVLEKNKSEINTRIFLALDINPHEEFSKVKWN